MKCLITGYKGQLGYDLVRELESRNEKHEYLAIDKDEMDITSSEEVMKMVDLYEPDVIFHCAAWTAVDKAEDMADVVEKVNVDGTRNIAAAAIKHNAKLIYISTDYVYDGTKDGIYTETDEVNPMSVYGRTKYLGECEARRVPNHIVARTSWVFGINGNNFVKTMLRLAETRDELNVVDDQIGSPTYTVDLARILVDLALSDKIGTYHTTNENFCSWAEFAEAIFATNNLEVKVNKISSLEYPQKAYRPKNSRLSKDKLEEDGFKKLPTWQDALDRYNKELKLTLKKGL